MNEIWNGQGLELFCMGCAMMAIRSPGWGMNPSCAVSTSCCAFSESVEYGALQRMCQKAFWTSVLLTPA